MNKGENDPVQQVAALRQIDSVKQVVRLNRINVQKDSVQQVAALRQIDSVQQVVGLNFKIADS